MNLLMLTLSSAKGTQANTKLTIQGFIPCLNPVADFLHGYSTMLFPTRNQWPTTQNRGLLFSLTLLVVFFEVEIQPLAVCCFGHILACFFWQLDSFLFQGTTYCFAWCCHCCLSCVRHSLPWMQVLHHLQKLVDFDVELHWKLDWTACQHSQCPLWLFLLLQRQKCVKQEAVLCHCRM